MDIPDWRQAGAYAPLLLADRTVFAWEWLRRDPAYRAAAERSKSQRSAEQDGKRLAQSNAVFWGLHAFEDPAKAAAHARPVWRADAHARVLAVRARPSGSAADCFDLDAVRPLSTLLADPSGAEHLLVSDGLQTIRLDIAAGSVRRGPVELSYEVAGFASAEAPLLVLRRLLAFWRHRRFSSALHPPEVRARRWLLALRVHDAINAGANQREAAAHLLGAAATEPCWRSRMPSVRLQMQRLVRSARSAAAGGYRMFLG